MRKNSIKNTRINGEVQKELSRIISREIKDPRIHVMTSVVEEIMLAKRMEEGDEEAQKETLAGLKSAEGFIRKELARTINLRNTPEVIFIMDQSIEYGVNMSKKIDEVNQKDQEAQES